MALITIPREAWQRMLGSIRQADASPLDSTKLWWLLLLALQVELHDPETRDWLRAALA